MRFAAFLLLLSASCAHPRQPPPTSLPETTRSGVITPEPAAPSPSSEHTIRRQELLAFLDQKPAEFLAQIRVAPEFRQGRYYGWRILQLPGDPRFANAAVRPGDVLVSINDRPVERPEQFFRVWLDLRQASELRLSLMRAGQPQTITYQVVADGTLEQGKKSMLK